MREVIRLLSLCSLLVTVSGPAPLGARTPLYRTADLQALAQQGQNFEYLQHARDIPPRERDQSWREQTLAVAERYLQKLAERRPLEARDLQFVHQLSQWPLLEGDEFFQSAHAHYLAQALPPCWAGRFAPTLTPQWCLEYWESGLKNPQLTLAARYQLLTQTATHVPQPQRLLPHWQAIATSKNAQFYCQKDFLRSQLTPYWREQAQGLSFSQLELALKSGLHPDCRASLAPHWKKEILPGIQGQNPWALTLMLAADLLSPAERDHYLTYFLLEKNFKGPLLNLAYTNLRSLAADPERRGALLTRLSQHDPLPGSVLEAVAPQKAQRTVQQFQLFFPEYFSLFKRRCSRPPSTRCQRLKAILEQTP